MSSSFLLYQLMGLSLCFYVKATIPSYIHVCHRSDPQIGECIIESIESLKPQLKKGIPELNVPSIEPLPLDSVELKAGPNQAQINADLTHLKLWDVSSFKITSLSFNLEDQQILANVNIPELYFEGDYDMDVSVLILKYKGMGAINGNLTGYSLDFNLKYDLFQKDGKDYVKFQKVGLKIFPKESVFHLDSLFNNNSTLARGMAEVIRDNTDLFMNEILPVVEEGISVTLTEIANDIAASATYDELLPL